MSILARIKSIGWLVLVGALLGAAGSYRYFITPPELRFARTEAGWIAVAFVANALLAVAVLLLVRVVRVKKRDD